MAEDNKFTLRIVTPDRVFYEDDAVNMLEFNTTEGEIGIYKRHPDESRRFLPLWISVPRLLLWNDGLDSAFQGV